MKNIKKIMAVLFSLIIMLQFVMIPSYASSSGSLSLSTSSTTVGKSITVTVTFSNSPNPIGAVEGYLTFNSSVLEYVPSTNSSLASGSKVKMIGVGDGTSKSIKFSVKFNCKAAGSSSLNLSGSVLDYDTEQSASVSSSKTVTVTSSAALSDNAKLKSLIGSYGELRPKFSPDVTSYEVSLPNDVTVYSLTATPADSKAKTEYFGSKNMKVGKNTRSVVVTAENGVAKRTYTIVITRAEASSTSSKVTSSDAITSEDTSSVISNEFTIGENKYTVQNEWLADTKLPAGFEATEYSLNDESIAALKSAGGTILVYAADQSGNNRFVIYDEESGEYSAFRALEYEQKSYILTERDRTAPVPTDFFPSKKEIDGEMTEIWTNQNGDVLIFAIDTDGNRGYFLYDEESGKIEFFASEPVPESIASSEPEQINWLENLKSDKELLFKIVVIEAGVILLLLILFIIFLCLYLNKGKKDDNDDNYYYDQNDGFDDYDDFGGEDYIDESSGAEIVGNTDEEFSGEISDDFKQLFDVVE